MESLHNHVHWPIERRIRELEALTAHLRTVHVSTSMAPTYMSPGYTQAASGGFPLLRPQIWDAKYGVDLHVALVHAGGIGRIRPFFYPIIPAKFWDCRRRTVTDPK
ncbi:hypothetical protein L6452_32376 [Arctium lappa]|uniref:Uncharacterized protein n=1 Tax=Arctium lappa TaxID=4217 RepID=A0ACB8Z5N7_ARCLA|nr:hypothetical protein L6452_32376 [Arctium lappa]